MKTSMKKTMRTAGLLLAISSLLFSIGCDKNGAGSSSSTESKEDIGEVLAEVNGMKVGTKEFDEAFARAMPKEGETQDENTKKQEVLDKLVADKLLYQEALKQGLDKDPKIQRMMINTLLRKDVLGSLKNSDISDEELQKYYDQHKDEFIVPEKVQLRRILIKADEKTPDDAAKTKAEGLLAELKKAPDTFKDVAIKESQDAFAKRGGEVGFISKDGKAGLEPKVVEEAFKLEANAFSEVFKSDEGYNILQVANKRERVERTFDQMKGAVLRKMKQEKSKTIQDQYIEKLKQVAKISKNDDKLKSHVPEKKAMPQMMPGMMGGQDGGMMPPGGPGGMMPPGGPGGMMPPGGPGGMMPPGGPSGAPANSAPANAAPAAPPAPAH